MASEEEERDGASIVYKMKVVQFLDRSVPIILQNDNGPCPLLAISNCLTFPILSVLDYLFSGDLSNNFSSLYVCKLYDVHVSDVAETVCLSNA